MRPFFGNSLSATALLSLTSKEVYVTYLILSSTSLEVGISKGSNLRSEIGVQFAHLNSCLLLVNTLPTRMKLREILTCTLPFNLTS